MHRRSTNDIPNTGPPNAGIANIGNAKVFSSGLHKSPMVPPATVSGVLDANPARKRKTRWAPKFGASAAPSIQHPNTHSEPR
jgi:hypothetical protein